MNNLKRVLSLGLVGTMLAGMMVMGASAADFTDSADIEHSEAVDVLNALEIIDGKPDGSFDPQGNVTRAEMAKMIAVAMNGGRAANTGTKSTPSFTDIKGHWAESEIEYCYDLKIISGRGDGTFDPGANVTGLEATKMVLTALGYDSQAYQLTGASWAVNTDELARKASPSLYDELETVMMAANATRDTAAQLIWNGLQNQTRKVTPATNKNNGEVTWEYGEGKVMLTERYGALIWKGTYIGNSDTGATSTDGEIKVGTANFPSDMSIDNIGEEVMVVFKDGKDSVVPNRPDKKDTIYGVFNTGATQVIWATKADMGDQKSTDVKIKVDGETYETEEYVTVTTNYASSASHSAKDGNSDENSALTGQLKKQSVDKIKFVFNDDNKIFAAYVTEIFAGQVTAVTSSKITINGIGTITLADNDVYEDVAKDDVVTYTRFYNNTDKDKAYFTITKAEAVEGKLEGFKTNSDSQFVNVTVDGTTYKINKPATELTVLTDDGMSKVEKTDLGDTVRVYLADGMVMGMDKVESSGGSYAVIIDKANISNDTLDSKLDGWKVTILTSAGEEETYTVHKDSTSAPKSGETPATAITADDVKLGTLIEYSISGGQLKIKKVAQAAKIDGEKTIWDESKRELTYAADTAKIAASDAVVFVGVLNTEGSAVDKYYAYNLRSLGDVKGTDIKITAFLDSDGSMVKAAYYENTKRPNGSTDTTMYGIVKSQDGEVKISDEDYTKYTLSLTTGEQVAYVQNSEDKALAEGNLIIFDETSDNCYDVSDFTILDGAGDTPGDNYGMAVAVNSYNASDRLLKYYTGTTYNSETKIFEGTGADSVTVDKDVKLVFVNKDNKTCDEDGTVSKFNVDKGYANAILYIADGDLVDVIFVETSEKKSLSADEDAFGKGPEEFTINAITDASVTGSGTYSAVRDTDKAAEGVTVKVTVTRKASPAKGTDTVVLKSTKASVNETLSFDSNGKAVVEFSMPGENVDDLALEVTHAED